jgi:hypothetical protein
VYVAVRIRLSDPTASDREAANTKSQSETERGARQK